MGKIGVFIMVLMLIPLASAVDNAFNITERTEYGFSQNTVYLRICDNLGKAQNVNISSVFKEHQLTQQIVYDDLLYNQSYIYKFYGIRNVSVGKYKTINVTGGVYNENLTIYWQNVTYYILADGSQYDCDYVLADKSCLVLREVNYANETRYDYLSFPSLKDKVVVGGLKIEQKSSGIPVPKGGCAALKYTYSHPVLWNLNVSYDVNKYNISVISSDGADTAEIDPIWWNDSYTYRQNITNRGTGNVTLVVNGTRGWNGTYIYTNCLGSMSGSCAVYYNSASDYQIVVNDTKMAPFYTPKNGKNDSDEQLLNGAYFDLESGDTYKAFGLNHYNVSAQTQVESVNSFNQSLYGGAFVLNDTRDNFNSTETIAEAQTSISVWIRNNAAITSATTGGVIYGNAINDGKYKGLYFGSVTSDCTGETLMISADAVTGAQCCITTPLGAGWNNIVQRWNGYAYEMWLNGVNQTCYKKAGQPWATTRFTGIKLMAGTRFDNWGNWDGMVESYTFYTQTIDVAEPGEIYRNGLNNGSGSSASGAMTLDVEEVVAAPAAPGVMISAMNITSSNKNYDYKSNFTVSWTEQNSSSNFTFWDAPSLQKRALLAYSFNANKSLIAVNHGSWGTNGTMEYAWGGDAGPDGSTATYGSQINTNRNDNLSRPFTVCMDVSLDYSSGVAGLIEKNLMDGAVSSWGLRTTTVNGGTILMTSSDGSNETGVYSSSVSRSTWNDVCAVFGNDFNAIYMNGSLSNSVVVPSYARGIAANSNNIVIGLFGIGGFIGWMDNIVIYNWSLSSKQIQERYDAIAAKRPQKLVRQEVNTGENWNATVVLSNLTAYDYDSTNITIGAATSTCTYVSGSVWTVDCADACNLSSTNLGPQAGASATGGTITTIIDANDGLNYTVHTFTTNGTFVMTGSLATQVLVVAGGGGGGGGGVGAGGGGAGGLIYNSSFTASGNVGVVVGFGGIGMESVGYSAVINNTGGNSSFGSLVAAGGGGGSSGNALGGSGGSGGGGDGGYEKNGGTAVSGQGNDGGKGNYGASVGCSGTTYAAGGGGGAGGVGEPYSSANACNAGDGGPGLNYSINGSNNYFAAGGGGGNWKNTAGVGGVGGSSIGGAGGAGDGSSGTDGLNHTGSGGGGSGGYDTSEHGGNGGDGIIIVRYLTQAVSEAKALRITGVESNERIVRGLFNVTGWQNLTIDNCYVYANHE